MGIFKVIEKVSCKESNGKIFKLLLRTVDNYLIEETIGYIHIGNIIKPLIKGSFHNYYHTFVCVSTQVGCPLQCKFCANQKISFVRNLSTSEIVEEVILAQNILGNLDKNSIKEREVKYGGVGEPLFNLTNVIKSIEIISRMLGNDTSFILSTSGHPISKLDDLIDILKTKKYYEVFLHVSLHASNNRIRKYLMNLEEINELFERIKLYIKLVRSPVILNYLIIRNINDDPKYANELSSLIITNGIQNHTIVKLSIPSFIGSIFSIPPPISRIMEFLDVLRSHDIRVFLFRSGGTSIAAGCGQLIAREQPQ